MKEIMTEENKTQAEPQVEKPSEEPAKPSYEEIVQERDKGKLEISRLQGLLKAEQRRGVPDEKFDGIHTALGDFRTDIAGWLEDLRNSIQGEAAEAPAKRSYTKEAQDKITKQNAPKPKTQTDIDAEKFFDYLKDEGLEFESDFVKDTIKDTDTPQQALKAIKEKVKERDQSKLKKEAEATAKTMLEQMLKDKGLTDLGVEKPSAPSFSYDSKNPDKTLAEAFKKKK